MLVNKRINTSVEKPLVAGIEAGGTKFVCAVGTGPENIIRTEFPTGDQPKELFIQINNWLLDQQKESGEIQAIGLGSFGPVDLEPSSNTYGYITSTPKNNWKNTNILGAIKKSFPNTPIQITTDVNAALLGEHRWGNGINVSDLVYITIGTGIGAGIMSNNKLITGLMHPEVGHMRIPRIQGDTYQGNCPFHRDCWEGLCAGPALEDRTGIPADLLSANDQAWQYQVEYIASAVANIITMVSPKRIILGGSVRKAGELGQTEFFKLIQKKLLEKLNGYISSPEILGNINSYIVSPKLGDNAGILGALSLAQQILNRK